MKKNNGFTLVELLAVITILGIIMIIGGVAATKIKKDANVKEAQQIEEMLKDLGPGIYMDEKTAGNNPIGTYDVDDLYNAGYLKSNGIKNPSGGDDCKATLEIINNTGSYEFKVKLCCPGLYETDNPNPPSTCTSY